MTTKISSFAKRNPQFTSSSKTANLFQDETTCIVFSGRDSKKLEPNIPRIKSGHFNRLIIN